MAHPVRLRMLSLLTGASLTAADIARELGLTHANASYHLRNLLTAGLIVQAGEERIRVWRLYLRAARNGFETGLTAVYQMLCSHPLTEPSSSAPRGLRHAEARRRVPA